MKYFVLFGLLIACAVSCLLGLTLGINLNPSSTTRYVLNWGSLGDWVAGLGAFLAVGVALWQSFNQSQKERIRTLVIDKSEPRSWTLRIVSEGLIPVTVLGAEIHLKEFRYKLPFSAVQRLHVQFPQRLERGDVQQLIEVDDENFSKFAEALVAPLAAFLSQSGIRPRNMSYGLNEEYFTALESYRNAKAKLVIRLAHDDISHDLAASLVDEFFSTVIAKHRALAEKEAMKKREEDQAFFDELRQKVTGS